MTSKLRVAVHLTIDLDAEQVADYAADKGLPLFRDRLLQREVRRNIRDHAAELVRRGFDSIGSGATVIAE